MAAPHECCGLLVGVEERVAEAVPARNSSDHPETRYLIDPADHFAAIHRARASGLDIVGFYHSHPRSSAVPSPTDAAEARYPGSFFLIVGLVDTVPDVRLYRWQGEMFVEQPLVAER